MPFYVYILQCQSSGVFYKGFTSDLERRVAEHQNNEGRWTANKGLWKLVYFETYQERENGKYRDCVEIG